MLIFSCLSILPPAQKYPDVHGTPVGVGHPGGQYLPTSALQSEQVVDTTREYLPAWQSGQNEADSCENLPAAQCKHVADPTAVDALPAEHFAHTVSPAVAPYLPMEQLAHAPAPELFLYVPGWHAEHVPPSNPA
jgi:hypothetical protein